MKTGFLDRCFPGGISLRLKSFLVFGLLVAAVLAGYIWLVSTFLLDSFGRLQDELILQRIERVVRELNRELVDQRDLVLDHAVWDDAVAFMEGKNPGFLEANYDPQNSVAGSGTNGQDGVMFLNGQKKPVAWRFFSDTAGGFQNPPPGFELDAMSQGQLLRENDTGSAVMASKSGLFLLSAHPLLRTDGSGPSPGWMIFLKNIGPPWFDEIRENLGVSIAPSHHMGSMDEMNLDQGETLREGVLGNCKVFFPHGYLPAVDGVTAFLDIENTIGINGAGLRLVIPATVFSTAVGLRNQIVWISIAGVLLLACAGWLAIEILFIRKIRRLDSEFKVLSGEENFSTRLIPHTRDEFGNLALSANLLLDSLRRQRTESLVQEKLLASVLETASEGIMAFRALRNDNGQITDFIIVLANRSAADMFNRTADDMIGKCLLGILPSEVTEDFFRRYVRVVETSMAEHFEIFLNHEELRSWLSISAEPWNDGLVVTYEEISSRKRAEQELKATLAELERFNQAMLGREHRILEMKTEVNQLRTRLGLAPAYEVDTTTDEP